jgi:hypothetical protein
MARMTSVIHEEVRDKKIPFEARISHDAFETCHEYLSSLCWNESCKRPSFGNINTNTILKYVSKPANAGIEVKDDELMSSSLIL